MQVTLNDVARYPFLPECKSMFGKLGVKVVGFSATTEGKICLDAVVERLVSGNIKESIDGRSRLIHYGLARVLVSIAQNYVLTKSFIESESLRILMNLKNETNHVLKERVVSYLGIGFGCESIPVLQYVNMAAKIRGDKWRLVNREVAAGRVKIYPQEVESLLFEIIKSVVGCDLPLPLPAEVSCEFESWVRVLKERFLRDKHYESVVYSESVYPPCICALMQKMKDGVGLTHSGRFALVSFLHRVGVDVEEIKKIFAVVPGYNQDMTEYQIGHILNNGYTPPSCLTMLTHNLCVGKDVICERVAHPIVYCSVRERQSSRS